MNTLFYLYIAIAVLVGAAITCFFMRNRKRTPTVLSESAKETNEEEQCERSEIIGDLSESNELVDEKELKEKHEKTLQETRNIIALQQEEYESAYKEKAEAIKKKYESLLSETQAQVENLNEQLKQKVEGNSDEALKVKLAEINRLKKQITDLQEEVEEFEDELEDYKKKLRKRETENDELKQDVDDKNRELQKLKQGIAVVKVELEDTMIELSLKKEALSFVQEILSATIAEDSSTKELYGKVDAVINFVEDELKEPMRMYCNTSEEKELFDSELYRWAGVTKKSWIQGKTTIAFVGEFSAGKTSIVNRILSQDDPSVPLLPVSTKASTAIPTYISGGISTFYRFVSPDNKLKNISESTFKSVNKEILDQIKGVSSLFQYFVMTYKNKNLDKLSILDTPGFNSNDKEDAQRTIEVINECDALFWVFDVNAGTINRSSIDLIKKHLKKPLFVVINKVDTKSKGEVDGVEKLIGSTLRKENIKVMQFIRFSSKAKLEVIMGPVKSIKHSLIHDSYIETLLSKLADVITVLDKETKTRNDEKIEMIQYENSIVELFNNAVEKLKESCESAAEIPQWTTHLFTKDRFEMSAEEGNRLQNILMSISTEQIEYIYEVNETHAELSKAVQECISDYLEAKSEWLLFRDYHSKFKQLVKNLKK